MGLDTTELIVAVEHHFKLTIHDERAENILTVEEFVQLIIELSSKSESPLVYQVVLPELQHLVANMFKIPIARITPEARFVKDLGLD